jgi:hypothetical protein
MAQVDAELAWSAQGDPVEVPATAVGWRVRKCPPRGGALERVNTVDQSAPLVVPVECSYKGFCEAVGQVAGKYRLDATDERGAIVGNTPAYATVGGASASSSAGNSDEALSNALTKTLETVERLAKTNTDAMERIEGLAKANGDVMERVTKELSAQLSTMVTAAAKLIEAADNAGITTRPPRDNDDDDDEKPAAVVAPAAPAGPSPWEPFVQAIMPTLPQILELGIKFAATKFTTPAAAKPAAAAAGATNGAAAGATNGTTNGTTAGH